MNSLDDLPDDKLLTTREASEYIPFTEGSLAVFRNRRSGPPYIKIGNKVFYRVDHLKEFVKGEIFMPELRRGAR
jgi:hypothetical protein